MKQINWKLLIGGLILLLILVAFLTRTIWVPKDPYFIDALRIDRSEEGVQFIQPPYSISSEDWLGSDIFGRDYFSRMVEGTQLTFTIIILLTLGKIMIALPLGLLGGYFRSIAKVIENWSFVFSGFPVLFAAIFIFSFPLFTDLLLWNRIFLMILVIVGLEWARVSLVIKARAEQVLKEPYIEGSKILGRGPIGILYYHVLRVIMPDVIVLFIFECARSLVLIGQLAIFGIYFIDSLYIPNIDPSLPPIRTALQPEWGYLLGDSRNLIFIKPAITLSIAGIIVLTIVTLNILGEGLRVKLLYPKAKNKSLWWSFSQSRPNWKKSIALGIGVISLIGLFTFIKFETKPAMSSGLHALSDRQMGTDQAGEAIDHIANEWSKIGLEPSISHSSYPEKILNQDKSFLSINGGEHTFKMDEQFQPYLKYTINSGEVSAPIEVVENTYIQLQGNIRRGQYDGKILVLRNSFMNYRYFDSVDGFVLASLDSDVKGLIFVEKDLETAQYAYGNSQLLNMISDDKKRFLPVFIVKAEDGETLYQSESATISMQLGDIDLISTIIEAELINNEKNSRPPVVLYTYYDRGKNEDRDYWADSVQQLSAIAKRLKTSNEVPSFDYYFIAIDGVSGQYYGFKQWMGNNTELLKRNPLMIQINNRPPDTEFSRMEGVDITTYTSHIEDQNEYMAVERALSVSAWKSGMLPFRANGSINVPDLEDYDFKHINLVTDHDMTSITMKFLRNLEKEYEKI